jgi:exodeoxyribonuclease VII small subunit
MNTPEAAELSFENAVGRLEAIVQVLEEGAPSLAEALAQYETGVQLLARCYGMLEQAERSVAMITGSDDQGNLTTTPFDATATVELGKGGKEAAVNPPAGTGTVPTASPAAKPSRARRQKPPEETEADRFDPPF